MKYVQVQFLNREVLLQNIFLNFSIFPMEESERYCCAIYTPITQIKNYTKTRNIAYSTHIYMYKIPMQLSRKVVQSNIYFREYRRGISRWRSNLHRTSGGEPSLPSHPPGKEGRSSIVYDLRSDPCKTRQEKIPARQKRGNVAFFFFF